MVVRNLKVGKHKTIRNNWTIEHCFSTHWRVYTMKMDRQKDETMAKQTTISMQQQQQNFKKKKI